MKSLIIKILTFHRSDNYGAVLQAFALYSFLKNEGHSVEFIDFHESITTKNSRTHPVKEILRNLQYWKPSSHNATKNPLVQCYIKRRERYLHNRLHNGFDLFRQNHLPISLHTYGSVEELRNAPPQGDVYICGSDQVWGPLSEGKFKEANFLNFGCNDIRRIAYAPSFGVAALSTKWNKNLSTLLSRFDAVSVREASGARIIQKGTKIKPEIVLDPTLLAVNFDNITKQPIQRSKYILVYRLLQNHTLTAALSSVVEIASQTLGLPVLNVSPHNYRFWMEPGKTLYPSPEEWLGLIKNASFVVTNSFHGTVFAIRSRRPFISFARDATTNKQNARMTELLADLDLRNRYIETDSGAIIKQLIETPILWGKPIENLQKRQAASTQFLQRALAI